MKARIMPEYKQQEKTNRVSMEEYMTSMPWRASVEDLTSALGDSDQAETETQRLYILRLLEPDLSGAFDRIVELTAANFSEPSDRKARFLVSVRPLVGDMIGRQESYTMSSVGLICDEEDPLRDNGYFMDARGIDVDELQNVARVRLRQPEEVALKVMALPLPEE